MSTKLIDIDWIEETKSYVKEQTLHEYGKGYDIITDTIDIFFNLSHFLNESIDPETEEGVFSHIAYSTYLRLPYTLYSILNKWLEGFYLESIVLLRHIIEGFVCLRYFSNNMNHTKQHYIAKKASDRTTFRKMFDKISPGFYQELYGKIYSNFAHGGVITIGTRVDYQSPTEGEVYMGCKFHNIYCKLILDQITVFSYGYLCYLDEFFPTIDTRTSSDLRKTFNKKISELKNILNEKRSSQETEDTWQKIMKPFVEK